MSSSITSNPRSRMIRIGLYRLICGDDTCFVDPQNVSPAQLASGDRNESLPHWRSRPISSLASSDPSGRKVQAVFPEMQAPAHAAFGARNSPSGSAQARSTADPGVIGHAVERPTRMQLAETQYVAPLQSSLVVAP